MSQKKTFGICLFGFQWVCSVSVCNLFSYFCFYVSFSLIIDLLCFCVCFVLNKPVQSPFVSYSITSVFLCLISLFVHLLWFLVCFILNKYFWSHMFSQRLRASLLPLSLCLRPFCLLISSVFRVCLTVLSAMIEHAKRVITLIKEVITKTRVWLN